MQKKTPDVIFEIQKALADTFAAFTMEHYGNIVTYLRLEGIVPPSSGGM